MGALDIIDHWTSLISIYEETMNVLYGNHRADVEEDLGGTVAHPFGGLLLSTGEAVGYDDPLLEIEPTDDDWADAHDPDWSGQIPEFTCQVCGRQRLSDQL